MKLTKEELSHLYLLVSHSYTMSGYELCDRQPIKRGLLQTRKNINENKLSRKILLNIASEISEKKRHETEAWMERCEEDHCYFFTDDGGISVRGSGGEALKLK